MSIVVRPLDAGKEVKIESQMGSRPVGYQKRVKEAIRRLKVGTTSEAKTYSLTSLYRKSRQNLRLIKATI